MNVKGLYKTGLSLLERVKKNVRASKAYQLLNPEQRILQEEEAAWESLDVFTETGKLPGYQLSLLEGGEARRMSWRERRRQKKLGSLQIWTEDEIAEFISRENRLLLVPKQGKRQAVSPARLERLVARITNEEYQGNATTAIAEAGTILGFTEEETRQRLKGFVEYYEEHRKRDAQPLAFLDKKLLSSPNTYTLIEHDLINEHGTSTAAAMLTRIYGMTVEAKIRPLDRIVHDATNAYNTQIKAFREGDTRAVHERYTRAAAQMGLEQEVYKDALREHVASSVAHYTHRQATGNLEATVEGYAAPAAPLERFDRSLLTHYDSFADEITRLYETGSESVQEIAAHVQEKYGMKVSSSHVSSMARKRIAERDGKKVYNRKEARLKQAKKAA